MQISLINLKWTVLFWIQVLAEPNVISTQLDTYDRFHSIHYHKHLRKEDLVFLPSVQFRDVLASWGSPRHVMVAWLLKITICFWGFFGLYINIYTVQQERRLPYHWNIVRSDPGNANGINTKHPSLRGFTSQCGPSACPTPWWIKESCARKGIRCMDLNINIKASINIHLQVPSVYWAHYGCVH